MRQTDHPELLIKAFLTPWKPRVHTLLVLLILLGKDDSRKITTAIEKWSVIYYLPDVPRKNVPPDYVWNWHKKKDGTDTKKRFINKIGYK